MNVLDIAQNSVKAEATLITIDVAENTQNKELTIRITDNGKGMTQEQLKSVEDPFFTTRTTRKVGMGVPLFKMEAEQSGGSFKISSILGRGTEVFALFKTDSVDFIPLGDMTSTVLSLICMNTQIDFVYVHTVDENRFTLDTRELKQILADVPLDTPEVTSWIKEYLQ